MKTTGNTMLITGGGTGIGEALAHRFHDLGNTVIIAGRRMETLKKATGDRPRMHAMTLDRFADQVMAIFQQTPTPREGVDFRRNAEAEDRFDETLASINPFLK